MFIYLDTSYIQEQGVFNMWKGTHSNQYKTIYDVLRYPYSKHKEILLNCRANLINHRRSNWDISYVNMLTAFCFTLYITGSRISECISLRVKDIIIDDNKEFIEFIIPTSKTRQNEMPYRSIPVYIKDPENKEFLKPIIEWYDMVVSIVENDPTFDDSTRLFPIDRFIGYYAMKVGMGFNPSFERKIFITQKAERNNLSVPKLQKLSGHRKPTSLIYYLNIGTSEIKEDLKRNVKKE